MAIKPLVDQFGAPFVEGQQSRGSAPPGPAENRYTLIYGSKTMGKTTYARECAQLRARRGGSFVWLDHTGRNGDLGAIAKSVDQAAWLVLNAARARRPFAIVLQLAWGQTYRKLFPFLYTVGNLLLVADEAQRLANARSIDPEFAELVNIGRNQQVDILATVRTPPELHGLLRGNRDVVITFRQESRNYADSLNAEFFYLENGGELIASLPQFHFLRSAGGQVSRGYFNPYR